MEKLHFTLFLENYERNKGDIEKGPYIPQMDLAITCHELILVEDRYLYTRRVTWDLLQLWDISPEELFSRAGEDARRFLPPQVVPLRKILEAQYTKTESCEDEMISESFIRTSVDFIRLLDIDEADFPPLYVVSNPLILRGASVVFYSDILDEFANEIDSDLVLLPSSIHEWFVLPQSKAGELEELKSIVYDANHLVVSDHEILSFNVYRYSRKSKRIEVWMKEEH